MEAVGLKDAVTAQVLLAGAVWFVPAATLMVMVALPVVSFTLETVTVVPETVTFATPVLLELALTTPLPARVTVIDFDLLEAFSVMEVGLMLKEPAALPIDHTTVFAVVLPSDQR